MSYQITAKVKKSSIPELQKMIRGLAGAIVLRHALGSTQALYELYPVGPDHKDGSPHTRDTFALVLSEGNGPVSLESGEVLASNGNFSESSKKFEIGNKKRLSFIAAGASFFLEWGTIHISPRPFIREMIKRARKDIANNLRKLNINSSSRTKQ